MVFPSHIGHLCHLNWPYCCTVLGSNQTDRQTDRQTKLALEIVGEMMYNSSQLFLKLFSLLTFALRTLYLLSFSSPLSFPLLPSLLFSLLSSPLLSPPLLQLWQLRFFMFYIQCCCFECSRSLSISVQSFMKTASWSMSSRRTDEIYSTDVLDCKAHPHHTCFLSCLIVALQNRNDIVLSEFFMLFLCTIFWKCKIIFVMEIIFGIFERFLILIFGRMWEENDDD